jgi:hypothetical protein
LNGALGREDIFETYHFRAVVHRGRLIQTSVLGVDVDTKPAAERFLQSFTLLTA